MPEVAHSGKHHRQPCRVGRSDHVIVADRSAGLDYRCRASLGCGEQSVGKREEGIRRYGAAHGARLRPTEGFGRLLPFNSRDA